MKDKIILQEIILPKKDYNSPIATYFRSFGKAYINTVPIYNLTIKEGTEVTFDTFYNILPVKKWDNMSCIEDDITFRIRGNGHAIVRIHGLSVQGLDLGILKEETIELNNSEFDLSIEKNHIKENIAFIYISIVALSTFNLYEGSTFETTYKNINPVKLAIVITHFKREQYVIPALHRIKEYLTNNVFSDSVHIFVIDNSKSLNFPNSKSITVINNNNYGGSGGFTRGLIEAKSKNFTHCLFMDDDGSCELESIRRIYNLFKISKDPKLAITGALLSELDPCTILQTGATYSHKGWNSINNNINISTRNGIIRSELNLTKPEYGAWPFFAFKISEINHYPFPFFVRGDDVLFGLQNTFNIKWFPGIAVQVADFLPRESPLTLYYDERAILTINLLKTKKTRFSYIKQYYRLIKGLNISYKYASSKAINIAFDHIIDGPDFFIRDMDSSKTRSLFADLNSEEKLTNQQISFSKPKRYKTIEKFLRFFTINGLLIPVVLLHKKPLLQIKGLYASNKISFLYRKIFYYCPSTNSGFVAERSLIRSLREFSHFIRNSLIFLVKYNKIIKSYHSTNIGTADFWSHLYNGDK